MELGDETQKLLTALSQRLGVPSPEKLQEALITEEEIQKVLMALAEGKPDFTDEEAKDAIRWAVQSRSDSTMLDFVLKGMVKLSFIDGDISYCLTKFGEDIARGEMEDE